MIDIERIHHVAIICTNRNRSLWFYTTVLGMTVVAEHYRAERGSYKIDLALGNNYVVELFTFPTPPPRPSHPEAAGLRHLAFAVEDIEAAVAEVDRLGVEHEPMRTDEYTGRRFFFMQDPDALPIEIYEL